MSLLYVSFVSDDGELIKSINLWKDKDINILNGRGGISSFHGRVNKLVKKSVGDSRVSNNNNNIKKRKTKGKFANEKQRKKEVNIDDNEDDSEYGTSDEGVEMIDKEDEHEVDEDDIDDEEIREHEERNIRRSSNRQNKTKKQTMEVDLDEAPIGVRLRHRRRGLN